MLNTLGWCQRSSPTGYSFCLYWCHPLVSEKELLHSVKNPQWSCFMKAALCEAVPFCAVTRCERQNFLFRCSFKAPMEQHFMRSVAPQSLSRNFTQTSLLVRCLRFFISLYLRPMAEMTHHKMVAKNFWAWLCLPDKKFYMFIAQCTSRHLSRSGIKVDPKETLCVPSASERFLMALQKGYFRSCSHSTLYLPFSPEVSLRIAGILAKCLH